MDNTSSEAGLGLLFTFVGERFFMKHHQADQRKWTLAAMRYSA
jgi:hypothetical protein